MPYYASPLGAGLSDLVRVLTPDPLADARAGMIGDQRRKLQSERSRLDSETTAQLIRNDELRRARDLVATLSGGPEAEFLRRGALSADNFNPSSTANAVSRNLADMLAQGTEDQRRQSLIVQGKMPRENTSTTAEYADQVRGEYIDRDVSRTQITADANLAGRKYAADQSASASRYAADQRLAGVKYKADQPTAASGNKGAGRVPPTVGSAQVKMGEQLLAELLAGIQYPNATGERTVDPTGKQAYMDRFGELFQQTRNGPAAGQQAFAEIFGEAPLAQYETGMFGMVKDGMSIRPTVRGPDGQALRPESVAAEARAAIEQLRARGKPIEPVLERVRQLGFDPAMIGL